MWWKLVSTLDTKINDMHGFQHPIFIENQMIFYFESFIFWLVCNNDKMRLLNMPYWHIEAF